MRYTESVIDLIASQHRDTGSWHIDMPELARQLDLSFAELVRHVYELRDTVDSVAVDRFDASNAYLLADLLSSVCGEDAHTAFNDAGILLSHEDRTRPATLLIDRVASSAAAHKIDLEQFQAMLRVFKTWDRAVSVYVDHFFDMDAEVRDTAASFCRQRGFRFPELARQNVEAYLRMLQRRNVLRTADLLHSVIAELLGEERPETGTHSHRLPTDVSEALSTLGLTPADADKESIRRQYRTLMKTFHPDVNPSTLALAQRITDAYGRLAVWFAGET